MVIPSDLTPAPSAPELHDLDARPGVFQKLLDYLPVFREKVRERAREMHKRHPLIAAAGRLDEQTVETLEELQVWEVRLERWVAEPDEDNPIQRAFGLLEEILSSSKSIGVPAPIACVPLAGVMVAMVRLKVPMPLFALALEAFGAYEVDGDMAAALIRTYARKQAEREGGAS